MKKVLEGHSYGVAYVAWSPNGSHLLVCGPEDCPELFIWNIDSDEPRVKVTHTSEDSLTSCAWHSSGQKFVTGGLRGQFYQCVSTFKIEKPANFEIRSLCILILYFRI